MSRFLVLTILVACRPSSGPIPASPGPPPAPTIERDFTQAERMLELLSAQGSPTAAQLDGVMATRGTQLILEQLNVSRDVTAAQYRTVLAAAIVEAAPALSPTDGGERAARGVRVLREDVWPALHWGAANVGVLGERIAALRTLDFASVTGLALEWLPDRTHPPVRLHVIMGGRAGADSTAPDVYFDVLATSYKASVGMMKYPTTHWTTTFFAHEIHHVGLAPGIARIRSALVLRDAEERAFDLVKMLVTEGSATYFINGERELGRLMRDPGYSASLADPDRLIATLETLLVDVVDHGLAGEPYAQALTPRAVAGIYSGGALMFDVIYRVGGRARADAVMRDPRQLLGEYNAAAAVLEARGEHRRPIDGALAARIARLGGPRPASS